MAEESDLERNYSATPRRLEQARENGQVARSRELTAATVALVAAIGIASLGPQFVRRCLMLVEQGMRFDHRAVFDEDRIGGAILLMSADVVGALLPLLMVLLLATLGGPLLLSGWHFSPKALLSKFSRLDPAQGLTNVVVHAAPSAMVAQRVFDCIADTARRFLGAELDLYGWLPTVVAASGNADPLRGHAATYTRIAERLMADLATPPLLRTGS
ncbi:MAG: EscU/YscU/HrcU family type III secretion system export apparatus switch protein [Casimicrobiaceae bacterium]